MSPSLPICSERSRARRSLRKDHCIRWRADYTMARRTRSRKASNHLFWYTVWYWRVAARVEFWLVQWERKCVQGVLRLHVVGGASKTAARCGVQHAIGHCRRALRRHRWRTCRACGSSCGNSGRGCARCALRRCAACGAAARDYGNIGYSEHSEFNSYSITIPSVYTRTNMCTVLRFSRLTFTCCATRRDCAVLCRARWVARDYTCNC